MFQKQKSAGSLVCVHACVCMSLLAHNRCENGAECGLGNVVCTLRTVGSPSGEHRQGRQCGWDFRRGPPVELDGPFKCGWEHGFGEASWGGLTVGLRQGVWAISTVTSSSCALAHLGLPRWRRGMWVCGFLEVQVGDAPPHLPSSPPPLLLSPSNSPVLGFWGHHLHLSPASWGFPPGPGL